MEVSKRMGVAFCLTFVGGLVSRRADLEFDESDDARCKQYNVQPLPEAKQRHFDQNGPIPCPCSDLRERASEEFDLVLPSSHLLGLGCGMKCDMST
jgi:hypothetical protein